MPPETSWKANRRWRRHTYYKVQVFDQVSLVWRDEKPAFDELAAAERYVAEEIQAGASSRIMSVDGRERKPVESD